MNEYCNIICKSCLESGSITYVSCEHNINTGVPGWKDHVQPLRKKSLFWHHIWTEAGRPGKGVLASLMRSTGDKYHRAVKDTRSKDNDMRKAMFAELLVSNETRDCWKEINEVKSSSENLPNILFLMKAIMRVIMQMCLLINT